jgi:preprotein translocase subunit SecA
MLDTLKVDVITILSRVQVQQQADVEAVDEQRRAAEVEKKFEHQSVTQPDAQKPASAQRSGPKVGRNDACPCDSGKKYKHCHGKLS